ncbi:hypothetical protein [Catenulispora rubra]|uniref:hypothetical protein n=1 Tax=Catenulispora rubra TaxID=280293 RepID=UPI001891F51B|nr:hypothetical protein [Catenulispora rubra]
MDAQLNDQYDLIGFDPRGIGYSTSYDCSDGIQGGPSPQSETLTPYPWVGQMQDTIGGTVFTVEDFVHGSLAMVPGCASHLVAYFDAGAPDSGSCLGSRPGAAQPAAAVWS